MTVAALDRRTGPARRGLPLVLSLALREQRNGFSGFYVFIACVALGVAAITGVGALADALRASFERQGEVLLGGDVRLSRPHKAAEGAERVWLLKQGRMSETATVRGMARRPDGAEQALVDLRGVDAAYPLVGAVKLSGGMPLDDAVRRGPGAVVDPILLERLSLKVGDAISLGTIQVPIRATIETEPDKITERLTAGPRVLVSLDTLQRSGLIDPGSLVGWAYALKIGDGAADAEAGLVKFREAVKIGLPEGGFSVRDRRDPSPQVSRTLERLRQFLTLVGLTALLVGGVGIANAVSTYIDRRRRVIATFKSLGATGNTILGVHLLQVLFFAAIGVVIGMALGLLIPVALTWFFGASLPIKAEFNLTARSLLTAAAYGFMVALLFTLWPLGRAEQVRAGVLFRDEVAPERILPSWRIVAFSVATAICLAGLAIFSSEAPWLALYYCLGVVGVFAVFLGLGIGADLGGEAHTASAPARACTRHRQSGGTGRADARRCTLAWRWSFPPCYGRPCRSFDRGRADGPDARGEPQLLRSRYQARRERRIRSARQARVSSREGAAGAHAARSSGQARRSAGRGGEGATGGAMGAHRRSRSLPLRIRPRGF